MSTKWRLRPFEPALIASLSREARVSSLVAQILLNRGVDGATAARTFVDAHLKSLHDPELLPGAAEAADRLARAIRQSRKIVIYGDYDVDGVCGTSVLWACLRLAGASPEPLTALPVRLAFAYKKKTGRREYVRVALRSGPDGIIEAVKHPQEGAGVITSLTETDGLAELSENTTTVEPGSTVGFLSYATLMG